MKAFFLILFLLLSQAANAQAPGGGPLAMMAGMSSVAAIPTMLTYEGFIVPAGDHRGTNPVVTESSFRFIVPVWDNESGRVVANVQGSRLNFSENVGLNSGTRLGDDLYRTSAGLQYSRRLENQKMFGVQASFGYAGDEFTSDTQIYTVSANYSFAGGNEGHWVLLLLLSNNSPLGDNVPIPGFFYIKKTERFTGVFGLPIISLQWNPVPLWTLSFNTFGPFARGEIAYGTPRELQFFAGAGWNQQRFLRNGRTDDEARLTYEDKRAEFGARKPLTKELYGELRAGYSFDRKLYEGDGLLNMDGGEARFEDGPMATFSVRYIF